jgi:hypothetical protein
MSAFELAELCPDHAFEFGKLAFSPLRSALSSQVVASFATRHPRKGKRQRRRHR